MPTQQRKHRRDKELKEAGRNAKDLVAVAQAEKEASDAALEKAFEQIAELNYKAEALEKALLHIEWLEEKLGSHQAANKTLKATIADKDAELVDLNKRLLQKDREIRDLKEADKEAKPLRRRLREKSEKISQLQRELSAQRREASAW